MTRRATRVYRSRGPFLWIFGFGFIVELGLGLRAANPAKYHGSVPWVVGMVMLAIMCARFAMQRLTADARGIRVINFWVSYSLPWGEIERFDIGTVGVLRAVCRVHTVGGKVRSANIVTENSNFRNGSAQRMVDELNAELASHVGRGEPTSAA